MKTNEIDEHLWYQKSGYYNNPFSIKPAAFHEDLVGVQKVVKDVNNILAMGGVCFVTGEYGSGKTTLMKKIINKFKGEKRVIYYSCNRKERAIDFNKLLLGRSWSNRLLRKRPKDMILLLDEVQGLNSKEQADIMALYKQGYFRSVCLVAKVRNEVKLTKEFLKLIGKNLFKLKNLSAVESIDLVRKRIGNDQLLSDTIIKKVHRLNPNPRALLENCEDLCRIAFENDSDKVADAHLKLLKK